MNTINKFYLKHAVYLVEVDGLEAALLLNYANNSYEMVGNKHERIEDIAKMLLSKKHAINFAYKFNGKIEEKDL
jgi:hypothetical protein